MATITLHYISASRCGKDPSELRFPRRSADKGKLVSVSLLLAVAFATIASMDVAAAAVLLLLLLFLFIIFMARRQYQYIDFFVLSVGVFFGHIRDSQGKKGSRKYLKEFFIFF